MAALLGSSHLDCLCHHSLPPSPAVLSIIIAAAPTPHLSISGTTWYIFMSSCTSLDYPPPSVDSGIVVLPSPEATALVIK